MTIELTYCINGCTTRHGDEWHSVTTESPSLLCRRCETRLHDWLIKIPDTYALLPQFVEHGTTEPDPEGRTSKNPDPPAPMRLDVIDLLDTRLGRRWHGTEPAHDRRGTIGTLRVHVERLIEERNLPTNPHQITVTEACALLERHSLWIAEHTWVWDLYDDIRTLNRALSDAIGDYRTTPVGSCPIEDDNGQPCGANLYPSERGGVHCTNGGHTWDADTLAFLGRLQVERQPEIMTAADLALTYGMKPTLIRKWAERGKVTKWGRNDKGHQMYDVAQARSMHERENTAVGA